MDLETRVARTEAILEAVAEKLGVTVVEDTPALADEDPEWDWSEDPTAGQLVAVGAGKQGDVVALAPPPPSAPLAPFPRPAGVAPAPAVVADGIGPVATGDGVQYSPNRHIATPDQLASQYWTEHQRQARMAPVDNIAHIPLATE